MGNHDVGNAMGAGAEMARVENAVEKLADELGIGVERE
jgi:uncharacterized membrane protein YjjP (DUF1212 family)